MNFNIDHYHAGCAFAAAVSEIDNTMEQAVLMASCLDNVGHDTSWLAGFMDTWNC